MPEEVASVCRHFRTKAFYAEGRHAVDPSDCSPTPASWCVHTTMILGPDDNLCSTEMCRPGRACYKTPTDSPG